jgi:hypothetical protein
VTPIERNVSLAQRAASLDRLDMMMTSPIRQELKMSKKSEAVEKQRRAKALLNESRYHLQIALALQDPTERENVAAKAEALATEAKALSNQAREAFK